MNKEGTMEYYEHSMDAVWNDITVAHNTAQNTAPGVVVDGTHTYDPLPYWHPNSGVLDNGLAAAAEDRRRQEMLRYLQDLMNSLQPPGMALQELTERLRHPVLEPAPVELDERRAIDLGM